MQLVDQRIYPAGETYNDYAIREIDHFEFLISYNVDDAINTMFSAIEQAAYQEGYVLLKTVVYYETGALYHLFDVEYWFVTIPHTGVGASGADGISPTVAPVTILLYIVAGIIMGIIGYILVRSINLSVNSLQYEPTGAGGEKPSWSPFSYAIVFIGAAMLLNAMTGLSKRVGR